MKRNSIIRLPSFEVFWEFIMFLIRQDYYIKDYILELFRKYSIRGLSGCIDKPLHRFKIMKILKHKYGGCINESV